MKIGGFPLSGLLGAGLAVVLGVAGCSSYETLPSAPVTGVPASDVAEYRIGSDDNLQIFVWRNPELSRGVAVRPDGKISVPLIEDMTATGKTPTQLARDLEKSLERYVQNPIVTVIVSGFSGPFEDRIRIVGEAARPQALSYRSTMTLLDVMISVGGITPFAAGNRATITRVVDAKQKTYSIRLDDLLRDGDMSANVSIMPGDVIVIPEAWF